MQDKIVLITGASSGIGTSCAKLLAAEGAKLILSARRDVVLMPADQSSATMVYRKPRDVL